MNILSKTFEKSESVFTIINNEERIANFKYVIAVIYERELRTTYTIHRDSRNNTHTIEMSKRTNPFDIQRRYKIYEDAESFEKAIKRIEKICDKTSEVEVSIIG